MFCSDSFNDVFSLYLSPVYSSEPLGLCSVLGCRFKDVRRNLQKYLEELKNCRTQDVFALCTRRELSKYQVQNLMDAYQQHGICMHHYPVPAGDAPDITKCCKTLEEPRSCLESSWKTITQEQYNYIHDFRENLAAHLATKDTALRSVSQ
ncbi:PREDICTED: cyclin-dependent kinase inhibitor 3 [Buceros rhinoceros silvestris]|uniref:cyclin-dependent kinase inhibitor 3 n=1 Tax=Buceros rhinoceros silvestris TaxID=175836 RepID=UPI0005294691|nr:PREDICTED: cyclin-dependent kinase inhibitor 3 [Buceros rhinoceros silvestris]